MSTLLQKIALPTLCGCIGGITGFYGLQLSAKANSVTNVLQVQKLQILGADGSVQIELQAGDDGPTLILQDKNKKKRISLAIVEKGESNSSRLEFEDVSSKSSQILLTSMTSNESMLRMSDSLNEPWVHISAGQYYAGGNHGQILLGGSPGQSLAELQASKNDARCELKSGLKQLKLSAKESERQPQVTIDINKSIKSAVFH